MGVTLTVLNVNTGCVLAARRTGPVEYVMTSTLAKVFWGLTPQITSGPNARISGVVGGGLPLVSLTVKNRVQAVRGWDAL